MFDNVFYTVPATQGLKRVYAVPAAQGLISSNCLAFEAHLFICVF